MLHIVFNAKKFDVFAEQLSLNQKKESPWSDYWRKDNIFNFRLDPFVFDRVVVQPEVQFGNCIFVVIFFTPVNGELVITERLQIEVSKTLLYCSLQRQKIVVRTIINVVSQSVAHIAKNILLKPNAFE